MKRLLLLPLFVVVLFVAGSAEGRSLTVDATARAPVPAVIDSRLVFVDPITLRRVGRRSLWIGSNWNDHARSPDGSLLALSNNYPPSGLELIGLRAGTWAS